MQRAMSSLALVVSGICAVHLSVPQGGEERFGECVVVAAAGAAYSTAGLTESEPATP
jgi:hypothetical protein